MSSTESSTSNTSLAREPHEGTSLGAASLLAPATVFVTAAMLVPLLTLLRYSLNQFVPGQFMVEALTLENYIKFFSDPYYLSVLGRTLWISFITTLLCLLLGFPLAYVVARTQSRYKSLLIMAIVLPLFVGNAVRAAGWMIAFGQQGLVNVVLRSLGIIHTPIEIMYTPLAVIIGVTAVNLPFMVLTLQTVVEGINRSVEEAAFNLGAGPAVMLRRVLLPLALPGVLTGAILCFILTMNAYATPTLLGGPKFMMMGPLVFSQVSEQNNWPFGAAVSFILMSVTLVLTGATHIWTAQRYRASA